jgi:hypothetical protein
MDHILKKRPGCSKPGSFFSINFTVGNYKYDAYVAADFAAIFITLVTL